MQALVEDDDYAEAVVNDERDKERESPRRSMSEWSVEVELLTQLLDRVGELIAVSVVAAGAKKAPRIPPAPRPATAFDAARRRRRERQHTSVVSRLLPNKQGGQI